MSFGHYEHLFLPCSRKSALDCVMWLQDLNRNDPVSFNILKWIQKYIICDNVRRNRPSRMIESASRSQTNIFLPHEYINVSNPDTHQDAVTSIVRYSSASYDSKHFIYQLFISHILMKGQQTRILLFLCFQQPTIMSLCLYWRNAFKCPCGYMIV